MGDVINKKNSNDNNSSSSSDNSSSSDSDNNSSSDSSDDNSSSDDDKLNEKSKEVGESNKKEKKKKIFIKNLNYETTEETLKSFFEDCGVVEEVIILKRGEKSRGMAFVTFATEEEALKGLEKDGEELDERSIKIELSKPQTKSQNNNKKTNLVKTKPKDCKTVFVGNLSYDADDNEIEKFFKSCGNIKSIRIVTDAESGRSRGFGYVEFDDTDAVDKAIKLNGNEMMHRRVKIDFAAPRRNAGGERGGRRGFRGNRRGDRRGRGFAKKADTGFKGKKTVFED